MKINENYKNLEESYLFSTIAKKEDEYTKAHPEAKVIDMVRSRDMIFCV